jgi:hypothetical protein
MSEVLFILPLSPRGMSGLSLAFSTLIQSYDIVCFVETKTDDIDIITLPGYKFVMKNRKKITKNRSGGIMVGFKDNLAKHIDIVNTNSKYVM